MWQDARSTGTLIVVGLVVVSWHGRATAGDLPSSERYVATRMVATGGALTSIDLRVGVNNAGEVAFTGIQDGSSAGFVATAPGTWSMVTITGGTRVFSGAAINDAASKVVAMRDRVSGAPPTWFMRTWSAEPSPVTLIGRSPNDFDSCTFFVDVNDNGVVAFTGLVLDSTATQLFAGTAQPPVALATYSGVVSIRPQISDDDRVVIRDNLARVIVWPYPNGAPFVHAGQSDFTQVGAEPGISSTGDCVAFFGVSDTATAIFISLLIDGVNYRFPVASVGPGDDDFVALDADLHVCVTQLGDPLGADVGVTRLTVLFGGTRRDGPAGAYTQDVVALRTDSTVALRRLNASRVVAVGDDIDGRQVSAYFTNNSLNDGRTVAVRVAFADGGTGVVRGRPPCNEGPSLYHKKQSDPGTGVGYLLRTIPTESGCTFQRFSRWGCNLTSTVNVAGTYGFDVTPEEFQDWLLAGWCADPVCPTSASNCPDAADAECDLNACRAGGTGARFISAANDFSESAIDDFLRFRFPTSSYSVRLRPSDPVAAGDNLSLILDELRDGRPLKLRVRNRAGASVGHYIMAYALDRPDLPNAQLDADNILVSDPGNRANGTCTLQDYANYIAAPVGDWLFDANRRVYRYEPVERTATTLDITSTTTLLADRPGTGSPIGLVVTDPLGRRLGFDPDVGELNEIPDGRAWDDPPFAELDGSKPVWDPANPVKRLRIGDVVEGDYSVEVIGIADATFDLATLAVGLPSPAGGFEAGTIAAGERMTFSIGVGTEDPCPEDVDGSGEVGFADILLILAGWGPCGECPEDVNGDGMVGFADILAVLGAWGPCDERRMRAATPRPSLMTNERAAP